MPKTWLNRPFAPNAGETLADYESRLATYAAANPTLVTPINAAAMMDLEARLLTVAYKTADETVNNSAALQNDDHLFASVAANSVYVVDGLLAYSASAAADLQVSWSMPSGATFRGNLLGPGTGLGTTATSFDGTFWSPPLTPASFPADSAGVGGNQVTAGWELTARLFGLLIVSTTAGTFQIRWAQNTATADNTKVLAGSFIRLQKV